jgi:hypothetical protein
MVTTMLTRTTLGIKNVKQKMTSTYYGKWRMLVLRYNLLIRTNYIWCLINQLGAIPKHHNFSIKSLDPLRNNATRITTKKPKKTKRLMFCY